MIRFSTFQITIGTVGALVAFIVSNYWAYHAGSNADDSLLIDTMSKYRAFYEEVREKHKVVCDDGGNLKGLYLAQYRSMLPVVNDQIEAPYDNPCPKLIAVPEAPKNLELATHFGNKWSTWQEFLQDDDPSMVFSFGDKSIVYPIDEAWRDIIIEWHDQTEKYSADCDEGKDCTLIFTANKNTDETRNK